MAITVAEVDQLLATPKIVVREMAWVQRLSKHDPQWYEFVSALNMNGVVQEGLQLRCLWKSRVSSSPPKFNFAVFVDADRVYAIDVGPHSRHKNDKAGRGRTYWQQRIDGHQEHLWSSEGYGYAEPLTLNEMDDIVTAWAVFSARAKISLSGNFVHPDVSIRGGQGKLL